MSKEYVWDLLLGVTLNWVAMDKHFHHNCGCIPWDWVTGPVCRFAGGDFAGLVRSVLGMGLEFTKLLGE